MNAERRCGHANGLHRCTQIDWSDLATCFGWCGMWLAVFAGCAWLIRHGEQVMAFRYWVEGLVS
jgi:hypothetical protein